MGKKKGELARRHRPWTDLAAFFGPHVLGLSPAERTLLLAHLPRLKAQRLLDEVDAGNATLHPDTLHETVLAATGSAALADAYRAGAIKARWRKPKET